MSMIKVNKTTSEQFLTTDLLKTSKSNVRFPIPSAINLHNPKLKI